MCASSPYEKTPARVVAYMASSEKMVAALRGEEASIVGKVHGSPTGKAWRSGGRFFAQRSAARAEQGHLCERLEGLFPGYPPTEEGVGRNKAGMCRGINR